MRTGEGWDGEEEAVVVVVVVVVIVVGSTGVVGVEGWNGSRKNARLHRHHPRHLHRHHQPLHGTEVLVVIKVTHSATTLWLVSALIKIMIKMSNMYEGGAQCIRIGVMEDNFVFGHILHFGHPKKVQLG